MRSWCWWGGGWATHTSYPIIPPGAACQLISHTFTCIIQHPLAHIQDKQCSRMSVWACSLLCAADIRYLSQPERTGPESEIIPPVPSVRQTMSLLIPPVRSLLHKNKVLRYWRWEGAALHQRGTLFDSPAKLKTLWIPNHEREDSLLFQETCYSLLLLLKCQSSTISPSPSLHLSLSLSLPPFQSYLMLPFQSRFLVHSLAHA